MPVTVQQLLQILPNAGQSLRFCSSLKYGQKGKGKSKGKRPEKIQNRLAKS